MGKLTHPGARNERVHSPKDLETITHLFLIHTYTIGHDRHMTHMHPTRVPHMHTAIHIRMHITNIHAHHTCTHTSHTSY